jgi:methylphosphotriester-DNA--protein-cysteine methyltransferase
MKITTEKFPSPPDLATFVSGMWITNSDGPEHELSSLQCCLPNGAWEIIFHLTPQRFYLVEEGKQVQLPQMAGFATHGTPIYWQVRGGTRFFGLVLLPETMELLLNRSNALRGTRYEDLRGYDQPIFETLLSQGHQAATSQEMADAVFSTLRVHLLQSAEEKHPPYFAEAMRLIRSNMDSPTLDDLSEQVYVGKRQLQRTFQDKLGFGPKTYSRILRFRDAIHYMSQYPDAKMTTVAHDFGYADQSHFIREFKDFTGQNPTAFFSTWVPSAVTSHHPL